MLTTHQTLFHANKFILTQSKHISHKKMHHLNISNINPSGVTHIEKKRYRILLRMKKKNELSRQACVVSWKKRMSLPSVLDVVQKRHARFIRFCRTQASICSQPRHEVSVDRILRLFRAIRKFAYRGTRKFRWRMFPLFFPPQNRVF